MFKGTVLCVARSEAVRYAARYLSELGIPVTDKCAPDVSHLLLPVPSFPAGDAYLAYYLGRLPENIIISGGKLHAPLLAEYRIVDFLQDPYYLASNAAITADCALDLLREKSDAPLQGKQILIIGWGRIGKCLAKKLEQQNAHVTISARKPADLAMIQALSYRSLPTSKLSEWANRFDAILNTVPALVLPELEAKADAIVMELASKPGISGEGILNARGLPGKMAPERSGKLIAETFIRLSLS